MKFKNKHVLEIIKRYKKIAIVGSILFIFSFMLLYLSSVQDKKDDENIKYLNDIIENYENKTGVKSYLNISWLSSKFAYNNDKLLVGYYYAYDGQNYYIIFLKDDLASGLHNLNLQNHSFKITGVTKKIPDRIKGIAIRDYNNSLEVGEEKLTIENFSQVFGNIYLNQIESKSYVSNTFYSYGLLIRIIGFISMIIGIIMLIVFYLRIRKISDVDVHLLEREMNNSESLYYNKAKVYLTSNYLIILDGRFLYYKYSDILWMYSYSRGSSRKAIVILTKDAKKTIFAYLKLSVEDPLLMYINFILSRKTKNAVYDEIWNTIASKNPNIKLGYSSENVKYFKGVIKDIKNEKKNGTTF